MSVFGRVEKKPSTVATYAAASAHTTMAASTTDGFEIFGSASKTCRVLEIWATFRGTNGSVDGWIVKRSTANSSGTSTTETGVPLNSANAAASAVVKTYTANPTTGTLVGRIATFSINTTTASVSGQLLGTEGAICLYRAQEYGQAVVLSGTAQGLCVNFNGTAPTAGTLAFYVVWTEE